MGISYGMAVEQVFSRRYPCAVCRSGPGRPRDGSAGTGAHSLTLPPFSSGEARCTIWAAGPNLNGNGNSPQGWEMV